MEQRPRWCEGVRQLRARDALGGSMSDLIDPGVIGMSRIGVQWSPPRDFQA